LAGVPLIEHVRLRVSGLSSVSRVVVATPDAAIAAVVRAGGGEAIVTGDAPSGTHRVAAAVAALGPPPDIVVNVQGDQPFVTPAQVRAACAALLAGAAVGTVFAPLGRDRADRARVKLWVDDGGRVTRFSRTDGPDASGLHVGIYAFTPESLTAAVSAPQTPLGAAEDLEQIAWMAAGLTLGASRVARAGTAVDTPAQAAFAAAAIARGARRARPKAGR
jgi:3-deoxy-manno-octulosonate cytidylyltransferase (CMP-KDO synthetase)